MAAVQEFGGLEDLEEVRWVTDAGEFVLARSEVPDRRLFGNHPELVREATFVFGSGARVTVDFSEASDSDEAETGPSKARG